jgi:NitT/TauT family transport system substrate-binding protein
MQSRQSRRRLLATLSSAAGVSLIGSPNVFAQQAPPETSRIRLSKSAAICVAPQYVAQDLLRAEGFPLRSRRWSQSNHGLPKLAIR